MTWANYRKVHGSSSFPSSAQLAVADPHRMELNPKVLVIGNLARRYDAAHFAKSVDFPSIVLHQMGYDVLSKQYLQRSGLVRMLWWVPEMYKPMVFSCNAPSNRSNFNVRLGLAANVTEVAGVSPIDQMVDRRHAISVHRKRLGAFDDANANAVAKRMHETGLLIPEGREIQKKPSPSRDPDRDPAIVSPFERTAESAGALQSKLDGTLTRIEDLATWVLGPGRSPSISLTESYKVACESFEYPQCPAAAKQYKKHSPVSEERVTVLMDLGLRLINIEAGFKQLEERISKQASLDDLRLGILSLDKKFNKLLDLGAKFTARAARELIEDQISFHLSPPLMALDRRSYEPLQAESSDFWPNYDLYLMDMVPKRTDISVPDLADSREATAFCADLVKLLFGNTNQPLALALNRIGINAGKDLIPMVPAITDARKGGRLNPDNLKVRMVTEEMIVGLVKAFFEWPFRPQSWELALANGEGEGSGESLQREGEDAFAE